MKSSEPADAYLLAIATAPHNQLHAYSAVSAHQHHIPDIMPNLLQVTNP